MGDRVISKAEQEQACFAEPEYMTDAEIFTFRPGGTSLSFKHFWVKTWLRDYRKRWGNSDSLATLAEALNTDAGLQEFFDEIIGDNPSKFKTLSDTQEILNYYWQKNAWQRRVYAITNALEGERNSLTGWQQDLADIALGTGEGLCGFGEGLISASFNAGNYIGTLIVDPDARAKLGTQVDGAYNAAKEFVIASPSQKMEMLQNTWDKTVALGTAIANSMADEWEKAGSKEERDRLLSKWLTGGALEAATVYLAVAKGAKAAKFAKELSEEAAKAGKHLNIAAKGADKLEDIAGTTAKAADKLEDASSASKTAGKVDDIASAEKRAAKSGEKIDDVAGAEKKTVRDARNVSEIDINSAQAKALYPKIGRKIREGAKELQKYRHFGESNPPVARAAWSNAFSKIPGKRQLTDLQIRNKYIRELKHVDDVAAELLQNGYVEEAVARQVNLLRRQIGLKYKQATNRTSRRQIYLWNMERYGDPLGPSIDQLLAKGKSWKDIIGTASTSNKSLDSKLGAK